MTEGTKDKTHNNAHHTQICRHMYIHPEESGALANPNQAVTIIS